MKFSTVKILLLAQAFAGPCLFAQGPGVVVPSSATAAVRAETTRAEVFKRALAEAGLEYTGAGRFVVDRDYRRGAWDGARPAFRTLSVSGGSVKLRLEMTKNISRGRADKIMEERFLRIEALYAGAAAYPGMITTAFEAPPHLRPKDLRSGPGVKTVKMLAATPGLAYGAGSDDLVSHMALLGYLYCENGSLLAQLELFFPKLEFKPEAALKEFDRLGCVNKNRK
ncbi:MAG: hypothetical protein WCW52_07695 [Elusimicrobiales bacterium]|jgi:hypothetical protein